MSAHARRVAIRSPLVANFFLFLAGLVAAFIGVALLTNPAGFYADYGIELGMQTSLLSEIRGTAGMLTCVGLALLAAVFSKRHRTHAARLGAVLYLGYAGGRGVGMLVDGMPHLNVVYAAVAELTLGLACVWVALADVPVVDSTE